MSIYMSNLPQMVIAGLYLIVNLWLLYMVLTPKLVRSVQALLLAATLLVILLLRPLLEGGGVPYQMRSYALGCLFLVPAVLIFEESFRAKLFVFFMNYTLTQLVYLIFQYLDRILDPPAPELCVATGLVLELAILHLVKRRLRAPVRGIIEVIDRQGAALAVFPLLSFALLACYDLQDRYDGSAFVMLLISTALIFFAYYLISVSISVTKRKQELERISNSDGLTGIYNRRYMDRRIDEELERLQLGGPPFSIALIDIDFFKRVNDEHGHDCGDFILKEVVKDIASTVRANDVLGRWGGEEFLLVLPATSREQAAKLAERVRLAIEERVYEYGGKSISATITIGLSVAEGGDGRARAVKRADLALYRGKRQGRNRVAHFDTATDGTGLGD